MRTRTILVCFLLHLALCASGLGQTGTVITVSGNTNTSIQLALNAAGPTNAKVVIPAGTYNIASSIAVTSPPAPANTSPSNLWIHCEPGALLQATASLSSGMILLQDVSSSSAMGSVRIDGCTFDMGSAQTPTAFDTVGIAVLANFSANTGVIEIDHNEFLHSTLQGVVLQTCISVSGPCTTTLSSPSTTQLLQNAFIHDNVCHDFSTTKQSNAACFESKNSKGSLFRQNNMYSFPPPGTSSPCGSGTNPPPCPTFGILCNGDNGCSIEKNICSYTSTGMSGSASCYKGLYTVGYESDGNQFFGFGSDCIANVYPCALAEHCDTCINADIHDNFYSHPEYCLRTEVNLDENVHDNRCYFPTEQGIVVSTREGQTSTPDTVVVNSLTSPTVNGNLCNPISCATNVGLPTQITFPAGYTTTCPSSTAIPKGPWPISGGTAVSIPLNSPGVTGLFVTNVPSQSSSTWITSPILEICIASSVAILPGTLQLVLSDSTTSLSQPHTKITLPGLKASTWTPVYVWDDAFGLNFSSGRGVNSWGIQTTSAVTATIGISVFIHDVPFQRHNIHGNRVVRSGDRAFWLAGALQDFEFYGNFCTDPGFLANVANVGCLRLDSTTFNSGSYTMYNGQVHDNHFTDNGNGTTSVTTRRGIDYFDGSSQPIATVRNLHNFFNGQFNNNIFYNAASTSSTDAFYTVSGTCVLTVTGPPLSCPTATTTFPAGGFAAVPFCVATDNSTPVPIQATPKTSTGTACGGTNPACAEVVLTGGTGSSSTDSVSYECRSQNTE